MVIAIILIFFAVGLFLVFHDDHDNSYTKGEKKSSYERKVKPASRKPAVSQGKAPRPARFAEMVREVEKPVLDFHFLDRIEYHAILPERTMSSFIAGLQDHCTQQDRGGIVGLVITRPDASALEVHDANGRLLGWLPMKDRAEYLAFNPTGIECPFAGHLDLSITGKYYADIRIVLPSSRPFVVESLRSFLG